MTTCADCRHCGPAESVYSYCFAHPPVVDSHRLQHCLDKGEKFIAASFQASVIPVVKCNQIACGEFEPARRPFRVIVRERQGCAP